MVDGNVVSQAASLDQTGTGLAVVLVGGALAGVAGAVRALLRRRPAGPFRSGR